MTSNLKDKCEEWLRLAFEELDASSKERRNELSAGRIALSKKYILNIRNALEEAEESEKVRSTGMLLLYKSGDYGMSTNIGSLPIGGGI